MSEGVLLVLMQERPDSARGLIHPHPSSGRTHHVRYLPSAALEPWIEHFWLVRWDFDGQPPHTVHTLPHPSVHITVGSGHSGIGGLHEGRFTRELHGVGRVFGIKFRPGGFYQWLKQPVSSITNQRLPLHTLFGNRAAAFERALLNTENHETQVELAEAELLFLLPAPDERLQLVQHLCARIMTDRTLLRVEDLCATCGLTIRQLQRLFGTWVGVSLKWLIQRYRLHEALEVLNNERTRPDWVGLATQLGYFDQAHFIRDFSRLVGETPAEYARREAAARHLL